MYLNNLASLWNWVKNFVWRRHSVYAMIVCGIVLFLLFHLSVIPAQVADYEITTYKSTQDISSIVDNPLYLPYKAVALAGHYFSDSVRALRAISILFFGVCIVGLYRVLKRWHSDKIALLTTILFASNATVLAIARLASPLVLLFSWSLFIAILLWIQHGKSRRVAPLSLAIIGGLLLYIPGAPYFFLLLFILFARKVRQALRKIKPSALYVSVVVVLLFATPLVFSFIGDTTLIRDWLLLPDIINWSEVPRNILRVPSAFIYRAPVQPLLTIGRLPIFDVASGGLFLLGLYAYQKYMTLERTKVMLLTGVLAIVLGALGQVTLAFVIVLPFTYAVIAAGVSFLLDEWYKVFPKNPFARSFGLLLVVLTLLMSVYYQTTRFLTVWPQTPETREVYDKSRLVR
jgi:hypothetical protein